MRGWAERFDGFVARKEREARDAVLYPLKTDLNRLDDALIRVESAWSSELFDGPFFISPPASGDQPAANLVFVQSRDGNTAARDPSVLGGGATDKHLIYEGLSRVAAGAVLSGAETIRGGQMVFSVWHPELVKLRESFGLPRHPVQLVATLRGVDLSGGLMFNVPDLRVGLLTVPPAFQLMRDGLAERPWITPILMEDAGDLPAAFRSIRTLGIVRVSAVGGRTLATALIGSALVQDLYLTTSAISAGEPNTPMYAGHLGGNLVVRKLGTGPDDGVVFEHVVKPRPDSGDVSRTNKP